MKSLSKISQRLIGKKFIHCSSNMEEGIDCFRLCIEYLRFKGAEIAEDAVYKGQKIFDYKGIYKEDRFKTMELARDFISSLTSEIKIGYEVAGDILIMHTKKKKDLPLHLGIDAGNDHVMIAVINDRVRVLNKKYFYIEKVLRWVQN